MDDGLESRASGPTATVTLPSELRFLEVVRAAVSMALIDSGCDAACERDLQLAVDELASVLIASSHDPSDLRVAVTDDGIDAYVRMLVAVARTGFRPRFAELTRLLLDATVDSYEIRLDGSDLLGVLQRPLESGREA